MQTWKAELLFETKLVLGEAAFWHHEWKKFLYVDIEEKIVGCIDPLTKKVTERNVGKRVGTVVPSTNGKLVVALQGSIEELDFEPGTLKHFADIETNEPGNRCNDGKCDALGRLWIGTMHARAELKKGALYCYSTSLKKVVPNLSVPNGICWTSDNRTMYFIDTFDCNIKAFDYDLSSGSLSNERVAVYVKELGFFPDGMAIDSEGMLWVAMWGGSCVNRYNPGDGSLIGKVHVPAPHVASCAFGGDDMQQLLITTARSGVSEQHLKDYPLSGSLFIVDTGIKGERMHYFNEKLIEESYIKRDE